MIASDGTFDTVTVSIEGVRRSLTAEEFLALPLADRVRLVLDRALEFSYRGVPVDRKLALAHLRRRKGT